MEHGRLTAIVDYGAGNIRSVEKAFYHLGFDAFCTSDAKEILNADRVVLPGDGSYGYAMDSLSSTGLIPVIKEVVEKKTPFIGICLGYQLLFNGSEEDGGVEGLSILEGDVKRFPDTPGFTVPQIGWNTLNINSEKSLYRDIPDETFVYFVHSYYVKAKDRDIVAATTNYILDYDSSIQTENIYGCQFHPEKSSTLGIQMLKNFVSDYAY